MKQFLRGPGYFFIIFLMASVMSSCLEVKEQQLEKKNTRVQVDKKEKLEKMANKPEPAKEPPHISLDVNVQSVKNQLIGFTSSFLNKKEISPYIRKPNPKYYEIYYLIIENPTNVIGTMIIYDDENPYVFQKNTDEFIEITLWKPGLKITPQDLEVGITEEELKKKIPGLKPIEKNVWVFEQDSLKAFFKIENGKVTRLRIGLYNKNADYQSILKNGEWR